MLLPRFDFEAPGTLEAACELLAQANGEARLMAGGTDLLVKMKRGLAAPRLIISLSRIAPLHQLGPLNNGMKLGAGMTMSQLAGDAAVASGWQALAEGAGAVGGPVIRNRATVGGNVVNARPCADTLPALMALGAKATLRSQRGERVVELDGFVKGPGQCELAADEILTSIELPALPPHAGSAYLKITRRSAMEVTMVGCAASVVLDEHKATMTRVRLVFTSVAPVPLRIPTAERMLEGQAPSQGALQAAAEEARRVAPAITDHRAPQDYRKEVVAVTARRALAAAIARAGGRVA